MTMTNPDRRRFLGHIMGLTGGGFLALALRAQVPTSGVRSTGRYSDSMIIERRKFTWPGGKTLAVWVSPAVEVWSFDSAADAAISPNGAVGEPDVISFATRDYGMHV